MLAMTYSIVTCKKLTQDTHFINLFENAHEVYTFNFLFLAANEAAKFAYFGNKQYRRS